MIRSIWVLIAGTAMTGFLASCVVASGWFGRRARGECACEYLPRLWSRLLLRCAGVRIDVSGADRVDWSRPAVIVANHQSWFDVFAILTVVPGKLRFVAKQELGQIPIFGRAWRGCGHISLDRSNRRQAIASLNRAGEKIHEESLIVTMFPEGTRSPDGRLYPFKKGAFVLAIGTGVPIVPMGISGSSTVMPKGSCLVRTGEIRIRVGRPIDVAGRRPGDRDALVDESRRAVAALAGAALADSRPAPGGGAGRRAGQGNQEGDGRHDPREPREGGR